MLDSLFQLFKLEGVWQDCILELKAENPQGNCQFITVHKKSSNQLHWIWGCYGQGDHRLQICSKLLQPLRWKKCSDQNLTEFGTVMIKWLQQVHAQKPSICLRIKNCLIFPFCRSFTIQAKVPTTLVVENNAVNSETAWQWDFTTRKFVLMYMGYPQRAQAWIVQTQLRGTWMLVPCKRTIVPA